eukprot:gene11541-8224_t
MASEDRAVAERRLALPVRRSERRRRRRSRSGGGGAVLVGAAVSRGLVRRSADALALVQAPATIFRDARCPRGDQAASRWPSRRPQTGPSTGAAATAAG